MKRYMSKQKALDDLKNIVLPIGTITSYKNLTPEEIRTLLAALSGYFKFLCLENGYDIADITAVRKKFHDAGRRSAPWRATSSLLPARPQNGDDGNRINRWLLPPEHKFYADEVTATAVEIKYYLQLLSMVNAPHIDDSLVKAFEWLLPNPVKPGNFQDPIQLIDIDFNEVMADASIIQSGHLLPLDREGKHEPANASIMLARSNQLQGNLTIKELLNLLKDILIRHKSI